MNKTELFLDLYNAYKTCRIGKKHSKQQANFELRLGTNLINLTEELFTKTYQPSAHHCFIIQTTKPREIFAAHFRDRVVHHYLVSKLHVIWKKKFAHTSYACRKNKGPLKAIQALTKKVHSISLGGTQKLYVLQMDIKSFFTSIHRPTLADILIKQSFSKKCATPQDKILHLEWLIKVIIENDARKKCTRYKFAHTEGLIPKEKSWFSQPKEFGIPIGNLSSQFSANVYLNELDHFIVHKLKPEFSLRYVDDFIMIDTDPNKLLKMIAPIKDWLQINRKMEFNDAKTKFTCLKDGIEFLGYKIFQTIPSLNEGKTTRILYPKIKKYKFIKNLRHLKNHNFSKFSKNHELDVNVSVKKHQKKLAALNSRIGHMQHAQSFEFRKRAILKFCKNKNLKSNVNFTAITLKRKK